MEQIRTNITQMIESGCERMILSKPDKSANYKKIVITLKNQYFQIEKFTDKQVFHENIKKEELEHRLVEYLDREYRQLNGFGGGLETIFLVSKKGRITFKQKKTAASPKSIESHNRQKKYLLEEGEVILPLVDMGIFTPEGKVIASMYDKFRQINRFIEIIDDYIKTLSVDKLNIIDFGCGKSYLTFILYYYLTEKKHLSVEMIGLDLKEEVIEKCNLAAEKYGYTGLHFELGDIHGYEAPFDVDMVVTLHACDVATDFALFNAISWNAKLIFSVPCCQHELNKQMDSQQFAVMMRYGIIKERFAALTTDAIRANLLEYCGYKTQVMEFVDLSHTPKNLLIRGIKKQHNSREHQQKMLEEVEKMIEEYHLQPMLYQLLELHKKKK